MKKVIGALLLCLAMILTTCGCSSGKTEQTTAPSTTATPTTAAPQKIQLTYMETVPAEAKSNAARAMIDEFVKKNQNVTIEFTSITNDQALQKLITLASANELPDVFELNDSWLAPLAKNNKLVNLDDYLGDWEHLDNIVQPAFDLGRVIDNKLYFLPYSLWGIVGFYNTERLAETGMEVPKTLDDFYNVAKAMNKPEEGKYGYAFRGGAYGACHALIWMLSEIGSPEFFVNGKCVLDSPQAIKGLEKYKLMYSVAPKDSLNWAYRECVDGFTSGVCGLLLQGNEVVNICREKMGDGAFNTFMLPVGSSGKAFDTGGQAGYAVAANTKHIETAIELFKFMLDPVVSRDFCVAIGATPVNKELAKDPIFSDGPSKVFADQLANPNISYSHNPSHLPEWGELTATTGNAEIQAMLVGQQSVEETAKKLAKLLDDGLAKSK